MGLPTVWRRWLSNLRPLDLLAGSGVVAVVVGNDGAHAGPASGRAELETGLERVTWRRWWIGLVVVGGGAGFAGMH
ncbi:hypothetical protein F5H01DRAFT_357174 [Linnemannia elongata]|nr:hypothetical protein F5H01DRAFT_357174 [Linnemannia elongata]